jgi:hypothetical protein
MEISAKTKDKPVPVKVQYAIPDNLEGMRKAFGDDVTFAAAKGAVVISLQAFMRRHIDKGSTPAVIQQEVAKWKPDVRSVVKQSAFEKVSSNITKLTPEERKRLLAELQKG